MAQLIDFPVKSRMEADTLSPSATISSMVKHAELICDELESFRHLLDEDAFSINIETLASAALMAKLLNSDDSACRFFYRKMGQMLEEGITQTTLSFEERQKYGRYCDSHAREFSSLHRQYMNLLYPSPFD